MKSFLILIVLLQATGACGQTWDEWLRQKKTQKKYLVEQIAALKIHLNTIRQGFDIAYNGLNTVYNIKQGNFNLHRDFFSSLRNVNPHIANTAKVADIIAFQLTVAREIKNITVFCRNNPHLTAEEVRYILRVYANLLLLCDANLAELNTIIKKDHSEMQDDERLNRITTLHQEMLDKVAFAQAFSSDTRALALNRARQQHEISTIAKINNVTGL